jgi:DNA repair exonuclease SbcCD ATPase subunit
VRITRLYLRNYRVYEDELDLELPPGLVGIYGPNGSGKSLLIESILWGLYGYSRTAKEQVRTAEVGGDCVTEVEFEHEGHLYLVRRTLSGINSTVKAQAEADGAQVAEGIQSVRQYVHSVLGMDSQAFRASVFAEQKQIAAFSQQRPGERRDLVLRLLGITPLDKARDEARHDARAANEAFQQARRVLPDLDALQITADDAEAAAGARAADAKAEEEVATTARARLVTAEERFEALDRLRQEHDALVAEGKAVRAEHDGAEAEVHTLTAELAELDVLVSGLATHQAAAAGLEAAEKRLRMVEEMAVAERALSALPVPHEPPPPDEVACQAAGNAADADANRLAEVKGRLRSAMEAEERAKAGVQTSAKLSGEGACPVCGQALGEAFEKVQAHRAAELHQAAEAVQALRTERAALEKAAQASSARAREAEATLTKSRAAWTAYEHQRARRQDAEEALAKAVELLGGPVSPEERKVLPADVAHRREAARQCQRIEGRLERRPDAEKALESARSRLTHAAGRLDVLREKRRSLGFRPEDTDAARQRRDEDRALAERAATALHHAQVVAAQARERATAAAEALQRGRGQHAALEASAEEARHLGRVAELMGAFRNTVVATVGPRLSGQAAELFGELTDHEYDRLEVDPETYEIQIRDRGRLYDMERFSGSETDLANLALRVAISEHVRLLSGGAVGLLVLDEVFGPLDEDRKARMLGALERLKSRFRQVLVVTHDETIKAELPHAIEVVKLPGRRATARLVTA